MMVVLIADSRLFVTIAVDLVVTGVTEPVRFIVETKAKIFPSGEKFFWSPSKPKFHETFIMELKEVNTDFPLIAYFTSIARPLLSCKS